MFMAQALAPTAAATIAPTALATVGAEIGTATLLSEVAGTSMMMGLPTLGAAITPTAMNGLAALAPQAAGLTGALTPAITPALTGLASGQVPALLNQSLSGMLSPDQIAQMTKGATDIVANAQTVGQGLAQATYENTVPKMFQNALAGGADQATGDALARAAAQAPAGSTNPLYNQLSNPLELSRTGLNAPPADLLKVGELPTSKIGYDLAGRAVEPSFLDPTSAEPGLLQKGIKLIKDNPLTSASLAMNASKLLGGSGGTKEDEEYDGPLSKFKYDPSRYVPGTVTPPTPYKPVYKDYRMAGGGVVELMSDQNAIGANTGYPMADINKGAYATPYQTPISRNVLTGTSDTGVDPMTGEMTFAGGGIADLGGYSDYAGGGRMLKGPGDGMSDNIPATIAGKQPARLANEEFVIPADVVSHLGNGSSEAGAKQLYKMMDRVRQARTGKKAQGRQIKAAKLMPA
jgi:hypothetical protein